MEEAPRHDTRCAFIAGTVTAVGWATLLLQLLLLPSLIERFVLDGSETMRRYYQEMADRVEQEWLLILFFCTAGLLVAGLSATFGKMSRPRKKGGILLGSGLALSALLLLFLCVSYMAQYNSFIIYSGWFVNISLVVTAIALGGMHASIHCPGYRMPRALSGYMAPYLFLISCFFMVAFASKMIVEDWETCGWPPIEYSFLFLFFSASIALMAVFPVIHFRRRKGRRFARKVVILAVILGFLAPVLNLLVVALTCKAGVLPVIMPMAASWAIVNFVPPWLVGCGVSALFRERYALV